MSTAYAQPTGTIQITQPVVQSSISNPIYYSIIIFILLLIVHFLIARYFIVKKTQVKSTLSIVQVEAKKPDPELRPNVVTVETVRSHDIIDLGPVLPISIPAAPPLFNIKNQKHLLFSTSSHGTEAFFDLLDRYLMLTNIKTSTSNLQEFEILQDYQDQILILRHFYNGYCYCMINDDVMGMVPLANIHLPKVEMTFVMFYDPDVPLKETSYFERIKYCRRWYPQNVFLYPIAELETIMQDGHFFPGDLFIVCGGQDLVNYSSRIYKKYGHKMQYILLNDLGE
ncbi:hypothetical protein HK103_001123 [Boothiomyces macroporosus]|uniref:Uncharacterized protein n=1 Tax=Boothiomyces macroporosus TaxID=261099 RepID=A0AAD5UAP3_9FUNG|nr:hypothetical protein HK103_001123 [Boothiomyces macroporosus]